MVMELITGLHPVAVREVVDDSLFEDLPSLIKQHHDGEAVAPAASSSALMVEPVSPKCEWPAAPLQALASVAARCGRTQVSLRTPIATVLPELEQLLGDDDEQQLQQQQEQQQQQQQPSSSTKETPPRTSRPTSRAGP